MLAIARAQRWEPAEVLRVLLAGEVTGRDAATRRMRRKTAGFPSDKTSAFWRPEESSVPAATQDALATLEWTGRAENLVIVGRDGLDDEFHVSYILKKLDVNSRIDIACESALRRLMLSW